MKIVAGILLLITGFFISCTSVEQKESPEIIQIATLKGTSAISILKMMDTKTGNGDIIFNVKIYNEPEQLKALMINNKVDFAFLPTTTAAMFYNKGIDYKVCVIPIWGTLFLIGKNPVINDWEDLKAKKVHVMAKGMTPDVLFQVLLSNRSLRDDIELDYSFPTHIDLANATAGGLVNFAVLSEPYVSLILKKNSNLKIIFDLNKEWYTDQDSIPFALTSFLVNGKFADKYPDKVKEVLKMYEESINWVNANIKEAAEMIVNYDIINDIQIAESVIPKCNLLYKDSYLIKDDIIRYLKVFYNFNPQIIGGKLPDEDFFFKK